MLLPNERSKQGQLLQGSKESVLLPQKDSGEIGRSIYREQNFSNMTREAWETSCRTAFHLQVAVKLKRSAAPSKISN